MPDADGVGEVGNAKCGDIMKIFINKSTPFNVRIWNPLLFEHQNNKITINELLLEKKIGIEQGSFLCSGACQLMSIANYHFSYIGRKAVLDH